MNYFLQAFRSFENTVEEKKIERQNLALACNWSNSRISKKYFKVWKTEQILKSHCENRRKISMRCHFENWKKFHLDTKQRNFLAVEYRNIILKRKATKCFKNWHEFSRKLSDQKATYKKMNKMADEFRQKILKNRIC